MSELQIRFEVQRVEKPLRFGNGLSVDLHTKMPKKLDPISGKTYYHDEENLHSKRVGCATLDFTPKTKNSDYSDKKVQFKDILAVSNDLCESLILLIEDIEISPEKYKGIEYFIGFSNVNMSKFVIKHFNFKQIGWTLMINKQELIGQKENIIKLKNNTQRLADLKNLKNIQN